MSWAPANSWANRGVGDICVAPAKGCALRQITVRIRPGTDCGTADRVETCMDCQNHDQSYPGECPSNLVVSKVRSRSANASARDRMALGWLRFDGFGHSGAVS